MKKYFIKEKIKRFFALVSLAFAGVPLYAQYALPTQLQNAGSGIKEIITGDFVKILMVIFLCASGITYAFNKDNEKVKRNCIAVFVGGIIVIASSAILDVVWTT
jgi:type IV secretory pathway VirB2 component (pilin)